MHKQLFPILVILGLLAITTPAAAQTPTPSGPIYIVVYGDSLSFIASRFNVPLADLMAANNITDPNAISAGAQLVIPGLQGLSGYLVTEIVVFGDTFHSLSRRHQITEDTLRRLNHITSPAELYAGVSLVVLKADKDSSGLTERTSLDSGGTLLESAIIHQTDPWTIASANELPGTWAAMPGDVLYTLNNPEGQQATGLPSAFISAEINPLPLKQGGTAVITISARPDAELSGILVDRELHFFPGDAGQKIALQGVHAMLEPGIYPLRLEASLPDGSKQSFEQMVVVQSGNYPEDPVLIVDPATIDPAVTEPENNQIAALVGNASTIKFWQGMFQSPAYFNDCFTSRYGNRRSYNNGPFEFFHTGLDFCGGVDLPIAAPAAGEVIFADLLTVRGNATIIDHGWGVYSGFWHQSEIDVKVGDQVEAGQLIGKVGGTGRVTGAHLHWEIWVNGVQVNPIDWLESTYP